MLKLVNFGTKEWYNLKNAIVSLYNKQFCTNF